MVMGMNKKLIALMRSFQKEHNSIVPDKTGLAEHLISNDVVPVVRCKDCKHYGDYGRVWDCNKYGAMSLPDEDDFCSYGERRE